MYVRDVGVGEKETGHTVGVRGGSGVSEGSTWKGFLGKASEEGAGVEVPDNGDGAGDA